MAEHLSIFDETDAEPHSERPVAETAAAARLIGAVAAPVAVASPEAKKEVSSLLSLTEVLAQRRGRVTVSQLENGREHDDAYADLGGGLSVYRSEVNRVISRHPLEETLDGYRPEPWHTDIRRAVEQFGLAEFRQRDFSAMPGEDLKFFSLHLHAFLKNVHTNARLLHGERSVDDPLVAERYGPGRTQQELEEYEWRLTALRNDLNEANIPQLLEANLAKFYPSLNRNELLWRALDDKKRYETRVYKLGNKPRIERKRKSSIK